MYIPRGVKEAGRVLSKSEKFLIYYDPDIDGAVAGELKRRFLKSFNKPFMYYINDNRTHGLKLTEEQLNQLHGYTIILVDASMTRQEVETLVNRGINVINIDHHHIYEEELVYVENNELNTAGVIINNQYPFEPEEYRFLSGAGVVYYVLNSLYPNFCGEDEKALVGLSLLSDIRPIDSDIAKDFLYTTYTHKSPFMDYLVQVGKQERDFGFGQQTFDRNFIDYTFSPKINALFRLNKGYDAIAIFEGTYVSRGELDVYRRMQNAMKDEIIDKLKGVELSNLTSKYVDSHLSMPYQFEMTNFIGLACSSVKNFGKTTFLYVREGNLVKRGSVRGLCDDVDYLAIFRKHGFDAEGHKNAFGIKYVDFDKVDLQALNADIAISEEGYTERKYLGRILEVSNLGFFLNSTNAKIADYNNYVRDNERIYIKYTGYNIQRFKKGKAVEYIIDGLSVMCFDTELAFEDSLILPVKERGSYVNFYLKQY